MQVCEHVKRASERCPPRRSPSPRQALPRRPRPRLRRLPFPTGSR
jgi:hypothetical protein